MRPLTPPVRGLDGTLRRQARPAAALPPEVYRRATDRLAFGQLGEQ